MRTTIFDGKGIGGASTPVRKRARKAVGSNHATATEPAIAPAEDTPESNTRPYPRSKEGRAQRLTELRAHLLRNFIGIDDVIDCILSRIRTWYVNPEGQDRQLVVNLWGTTGVGKTCLVRSIRDYLGFSPAYLEVILSNKEGGYDVMDEMDHYSSIGTGAPGIILFDEFQRMRTKDSHGEPLRGLGHQDLWQILSDGKVSKQVSVAGLYRLMGSLNWSPFTGFGAIKKADTTDSDSIALSCDNQQKAMESILGVSLGNDPARVAAALPKDISVLQEAGKSLSTLRQLLAASSVEVPDSLEGILRGAYSLILANDNKGQLSASTDFTKCLIFIAGNLDDLYAQHLGEIPVVAPADYISKMSSLISVPEVKEALGHLFFPEQVARLGNIHITYSTLSSSSYHRLIDHYMASHVSQLSSAGYALEHSIHDLVYRNGVYPIQGVRPVLSTIAEVLSEVDTMLGQLPHVAQPGAGLTIRYSMEDLSLQVLRPDGGILHSYRYVGGKDSVLLPLTDTDPYVRFVATHEAGHIATFFVKTGGAVPAMAFIDNERAATDIGSAPSGSPALLCATVESLLSGAAATKLSGFTVEDSGHIGDYSSAASLVTVMVRSKGLGGYLGARYGVQVPSFYASMYRPYTIPGDPHLSGSSLLAPSDSSEAVFIAELLGKAAEQACKAVEENLTAISAVADLLAKKLFLGQEELSKVLMSNIAVRKTMPGAIRPPKPLR